MKKQQLSLISLLLLLGLVFILNNGVLLSKNLLSISLTTQVLIVFSAVLTIAIPVNTSRGVIFSVIFWAGMYLLVHLLPWQPRSLMGGVDTYITITELSLLVLVSASAYGVSYHQHELQRAIDTSALLKQNKNIYSYDESLEEIKTEFVRSRRHDHALTIMVIEPTGYSLKEDLQKALRQIHKMISERFVVASIGQILVTQTRRTDLVVDFNNQGKYIVACPETENDECTLLAERIRDEINQQFGINVKFGIAAFPGDALTYEDLIKQAETNIEKTFSTPVIQTVSDNVPS